MGKLLLGFGFVLLSVAIACGGSSNAKDDDDGGTGGATGGSGGATGGSGGATGGSTTGGSGGTSGGKGGSGGGAGMNAGIPIESLPTRLSASVCKLIFECCSADQRATNPFVGDTEAECRSNYAAIYTLILPEINQSIALGRTRYDGVALEACLAAFEANGCSGDIDDPAECEGVAVPLVEVGGSCTQPGECIGSTCLGADPTNDVDGVCGAPRANGSDCTDDEECASGYCSGVSCEPKAADGAECTTDPACESGFCDPSGVCATLSSSICE
jgi:hypothetical protein